MEEVWKLVLNGNILFKREGAAEVERKMFNKFLMLKKMKEKKRFKFLIDHFQNFEQKGEDKQEEANEERYLMKNSDRWADKLPAFFKLMAFKGRSSMEKIKNKTQEWGEKFETNIVCKDENSKIGSIITNTMGGDSKKDACAFMKTVSNTDDDYHRQIKEYILDAIKKLQELLDSLPASEDIENEKVAKVELKKKFWVPLYDLLFEPIPNTNMTFFAYILFRMGNNESPQAKTTIDMMKNMDGVKINGINIFNSAEFGWFNGKKNFVDEAKKTFDELGNASSTTAGGSRRKTKKGKTKRKKDKKKRKTKRKK